jgi:hypothetical protein
LFRPAALAWYIAVSAFFRMASPLAVIREDADADRRAGVQFVAIGTD